MNLELQILQSKNIEEFKALIMVFEDVFEMKYFKLPNKDYLQTILDKDNFFAVIAKADNIVIGGLTIYILDQYYSSKPLAYLFDLAVIKEYQRKRVGTRLIEFTNNYCRQKGFEEVFVQADKVDKYAIDFYRSTKPTEEEQVVHFYYKLTDDNL